MDPRQWTHLILNFGNQRFGTTWFGVGIGAAFFGAAYLSALAVRLTCGGLLMDGLGSLAHPATINATAAAIAIRFIVIPFLLASW